MCSVPMRAKSAHPRLSCRSRREVGYEELASAREVFITHVRWGVQSVDELDRRPLPDRSDAQRQLIDATHP